MNEINLHDVKDVRIRQWFSSDGFAWTTFTFYQSDNQKFEVTAHANGRSQIGLILGEEE